MSKVDPMWVVIALISGIGLVCLTVSLIIFYCEAEILERAIESKVPMKLWWWKYKSNPSQMENWFYSKVLEEYFPVPPGTKYPGEYWVKILHDCTVINTDGTVSIRR